MKDKKTQPYTMSNIEFLINNKKLNFNPRYQRNFVWDKSQKEIFIDSIIIGYDIPKIYFHQKKNDEFDVVDGQQRLLTIHEFMKDEIKVYSDADKIKGKAIAGKLFSELPQDIQMEFQNHNLDVVILNKDYKNDDIEDMFLRYQNGEPLNAPEKRRAVSGNFKDIVMEISKHKIFKKCFFDNKRYGYEDAVAKVLHVRFHGTFTSITPSAIKKTYELNKDITIRDKNVKHIQRAFNYLNKSFDLCDDPSPSLKKNQILTYTELIHHLLEHFAVLERGSEIANTLNQFEVERLKNNEFSEDKRDRVLSSFNDAARGDSPAFQSERFYILLKYILTNIPDLETKDPKRSFTDGQRRVIYSNSGGRCEICEKEVDKEEFEADHIIPHSKGGKTIVENGQLLCVACNRKKSNS